MTLDQSGVVIGFLERKQRLPQLLDTLEGPHPQQVLLQGADEPLGAAIAFRGADKGRRAVDPPTMEGGQHTSLPSRQRQKFATGRAS